MGWGGLHCLDCGILVPQAGVEPGPSTVRMQKNPNYWTSRAFPWNLYRWRKFQKGRDLQEVTGRERLLLFGHQVVSDSV